MNCQTYIRHLEKGENILNPECLDHAEHCASCADLTQKLEASMDVLEMDSVMRTYPFFTARIENAAAVSIRPPANTFPIRVLAGIAAVMLITVTVAAVMMISLRQSAAENSRQNSNQLGNIIYEYQAGEQNITAWEELFYENNQ